MLRNFSWIRRHLELKSKFFIFYMTPITCRSSISGWNLYCLTWKLAHLSGTTAGTVFPPTLWPAQSGTTTSAQSDENASLSGKDATLKMNLGAPTNAGELPDQMMPKLLDRKGQEHMRYFEVDTK